MTDFRTLLEVLAQAGVELIVVGGVAAAAHGSARLTADLDRWRRSSRASRTPAPPTQAT